MYRCRAQYPVWQPIRPGQATAAGQTGVVDDRSLLIDEINTIGLPVGIILGKVVTWLTEKTLESVELEFQQRAFIDIAGPIDANFAAGAGQVRGAVILEPSGLDQQVAPAQRGPAFHHRFQIGVAKQALTGDKCRQGAARHGDLLLQPGTGAECQWRLIRLSVSA